MYCVQYKLKSTIMCTSYIQNYYIIYAPFNDNLQQKWGLIPYYNNIYINGYLLYKMKDLTDKFSLG